MVDSDVSAAEVVDTAGGSVAIAAAVGAATDAVLELGEYESSAARVRAPAKP